MEQGTHEYGVGGDARGAEAHEEFLPTFEEEAVRSGIQAVRESLRNRFTHARIHVEDIQNREIDTSEVAGRVWYQPKDEEYLLDNCQFRMINRGGFLDDIMPQTHYDSWINPTPEKQAYFDYANTHIEIATKKLHNEGSLHWSASAYKCSGEGEIKRAKGGTRPDDRLLAPLQRMGIPYEKASVSGFFQRVHAGFLSNMSDSMGRMGLEAILQYACKIAFGCDFDNNGEAKIYSGCSYPFSDVSDDRFPVDMISFDGDSNFYNGRIPWKTVLSWSYDSYNYHSGSPSYPRSCPHSCSHSCSGSVSSIESPSSPSTAIELPFVYPDMVVASMDNGGWAKFLLLCKLSCGFHTFTNKEYTQLVRQMVGACMHQTEVFGLLFNSGNARLLWLKNDPIKKELVCYDSMNLYFFTTLQSPFFKTEELQRLLLHLVLVLDYAKKNLCEVRPPLPGLCD